MAELAAVAAIIGISSFAFQGIQEAYEFVDGMVKAPDNVKRVATEAKQLQAVLKSIPTQDDAVPVVHTVTQEMELAKVITACDKACHDFVEMLKQWMSNPDEPSLVDRGRVWAHRKAIQTCRDIVRDTKATVTLAEVVAVKFVTLHPSPFASTDECVGAYKSRPCDDKVWWATMLPHFSTKKQPVKRSRSGKKLRGLLSSIWRKT